MQVNTNDLATLRREIFKVTESPVIRKILPFMQVDVHEEGPLVKISTDRNSLELVASFRKDFIEEDEAKNVETMLRHDIYHVILDHEHRVDCDEPDGELCRETDVNRWLSDEDADRVRDTSTKYGFNYIDPREVFKNAGFPEKALRNVPVEFLHMIIHEMVEKEEFKQPQGSGNGEGAPCDGGGHGNSMAGDEKLDEQIRQSYAAAVAPDLNDELEANGHGGMPGSGRGDQEGNLHLNVGMKSPAWLTELMKWVKENVVQPSWMEKRAHSRPNLFRRQLGIHTPTYKRRAAFEPRNVVFGVDTSGSMVSELEPVEFVVRYLEQHNISVRLIMCDTRIAYDGPALPWPGIKGGGGTILRPMVDRIKATKDKDTNAVIWFSDGWWEDQPYVDDDSIKQVYIVPKQWTERLRGPVTMIDWNDGK